MRKKYSIIESTSLAFITNLTEFLPKHILIDVYKLRNILQSEIYDIQVELIISNHQITYFQKKTMLSDFHTFHCNNQVFNKCCRMSYTHVCATFTLPRFSYIFFKYCSNRSGRKNTPSYYQRPSIAHYLQDVLFMEEKSHSQH